MNILPPMMTVWHHCAKKYLGDRVDIVIFDCSGKLDAGEFAGARVQKFLNLYAATKCDEFIRHIAKNRAVTWLCDDDIFFLSAQAVDAVEREMNVERTASVSFRARNWWKFSIDGKEIPPSGSYCLALNRDIFWEREHLSLAPAPNNVHAAERSQNRRYDTFDKANEILLKKDYRCAILPSSEADECITGFSGMSGAVMLLNYFKTSDQVLDYYRAPDKKLWSGSVLPGTLGAMLAIRTIQECYRKLKGREYPLPSLPSRSDLERLRDEHRQYLRSDFTAWDDMEKAGERLMESL